MSTLRQPFPPISQLEDVADRAPARAEAPRNPREGELRGEVTELLQGLVEGKSAAAEALMPLIYDELRRIARSCMRRERPNHTLEPTALVHEVYFRLVAQNGATWQSRAHFFSIAACIMRRVLVDSSRSRLRHKRGHGAEHQEYIDAEISVGGRTMSAIDVLALNDALDQLAAVDARMEQIVEMRFFAGLDNAEIAAMLQISESTVKRSWSVARAWLARYLAGA